MCSHTFTKSPKILLLYTISISFIRSISYRYCAVPSFWQQPTDKNSVFIKKKKIQLEYTDEYICFSVISVLNSECEINLYYLLTFNLGLYSTVCLLDPNHRRLRTAKKPDCKKSDTLCIQPGFNFDFKSILNISTKPTISNIFVQSKRYETEYPVFLIVTKTVYL